MPAYSQFLTTPLDFGGIQKRVDVMAMLGVPYGDAMNNAEPMARAQAKAIAAAIVEQGGPAGLEDKQMVAIIAYIQRLGHDIKVAKVATSTGEAPRP
jgi:cytochrome c oxidase cbb3-type subunit I/II